MIKKIVFLSFFLMIFFTYSKAFGFDALNNNETDYKNYSIQRLTDHKIIDQKVLSLNNMDKSFTKEEVAYIMSNYYINIKKQKANEKAKDCVFKDINKISKKFQSGVILSCKLGIFKGTNGYFNPTKIFNNGEMVAILMKSEYGKLNESGKIRYSEYLSKIEDLQIQGGPYGEGWSASDSLSKSDFLISMYQLGFMNTYINSSKTSKKYIQYKDGDNKIAFYYNQSDAKVKKTGTCTLIDFGSMLIGIFSDKNSKSCNYNGSISLYNKGGTLEQEFTLNDLNNNLGVNYSNKLDTYYGVYIPTKGTTIAPLDIKLKALLRGMIQIK